MSTAIEDRHLLNHVEQKFGFAPRRRICQGNTEIKEKAVAGHEMCWWFFCSWFINSVLSSDIVEDGG